MKKQAQALGGYVQLYEQSASSAEILNRHEPFKVYSFGLLAWGLEFWPSCLNDRAPIAWTDDVPDNQLTAELLASGILSAFPRR